MYDDDDYYDVNFDFNDDGKLDDLERSEMLDIISEEDQEFEKDYSGGGFGRRNSSNPDTGLVGALLEILLIFLGGLGLVLLWELIKCL